MKIEILFTPLFLSLIGAAPPIDISNSDFVWSVQKRTAQRLAQPHHLSAVSDHSVIPTPRFIYVRDRTLSLPTPPWYTEEAYAEAFDLSHEAFFNLQPNGPRSLMIFTTFDDGGGSLFYLPMANDINGLGDGPAAAIFDDTPETSLDGFVWMGSVEELEEAGEGYFTVAFLHELAHRWLAYVAIDHPTLPRDALLGRQDSHWSFLLDTDNSPMEGNNWEPLENNFYQTDFATPPVFAFSRLDLYFMGAMRTSQVPPFMLITSYSHSEPSWFSVSPEARPASRTGVQVSLRVGSAEMISMREVVAGSGQRYPPATLERVVWPMGVVLLSNGLTRDTLADLQRLDNWLANMVDAFADASEGRVILDLDIRGAGALPFGAACYALAQCNRTLADICAAPATGEPMICTRSCLTREDCGDGFCCASTDAEGLCIPDRFCHAPVSDAGVVEPGPPDPIDPNQLEEGGASCTATGELQQLDLLLLRRR